MEKNNLLNAYHATPTEDVTDFVDAEGTLVEGVKTRPVMVRDAEDLTTLWGICEPGTIAYTAGFRAMWQLSADGVWTDLLGDNDVAPEEETTDEDTTDEGGEGGEGE